jgi:uncharacterized protein (UPF0332 family)
MRDLKEAEAWLDSARQLLGKEAMGDERYTVIVAQSIHSIIRANDALTMSFLDKKAIRHEDSPRMFLDMITANKIQPQYASLRKDILFPSVQTKSEADYKGTAFSKKEALSWIWKAERFLKASKECLSISGEQ